MSCPVCRNPEGMCICEDDGDALNDLLESSGEEHDLSGEELEVVRSPRKRDRVSEGEADPSPRSTKQATRVAQIPVRLGRGQNQLRLGKRTFRFCMWNVENFTGDLIKQGRRLTRSPIDSDKNKVRIEVIADLVTAMDVEAMAIMEMGSDAGHFLGQLTEALNQRSGGSEWHHTMSADVGATRTPPTSLCVDYSEYRPPERRIWALSTLLPYYTVMDLRSSERSPRRHLDALLLMASLLGEDDLAIELESLDADGIEHRRICEIVEHHYPDSDRAERRLEALTSLFTTSDGNAGILKYLLDKQYYDVFALFAAMSGAEVDLQRNGEPIDTDGPRAALRFLGHNTGRYEKYGLVWCTGLHEAYLRNELVATHLLAEHARTNSRAAMRFPLPLGMGAFLNAYVIHSMWTPASGETARDRSSDRELRMRTLEVQAEEARKLPKTERPLFIMGDTNVNSKDLDELNGRMEKHGYVRLGDPVKTTLRTEKVLLRTGETELLSEPYDAVYQDRERFRGYPSRVSFPDHRDEAVLQVMLNMISRNALVRRWYFELLVTLYAPLHRVAYVSRTSDDYILAVRQAIEKVCKDLGLAHARPSSLREAPSSPLSWRFLRQLTTILRGLEPGKGADKRMVQAVRGFLELSPDSERCFLLFHRTWISDHRMVLLDVDYMGLAGRTKAPRGHRSASSWPASSTSGPLRIVTPIDAAITARGFDRGTASGRGLSCFLYTLRQLTDGRRDRQDDEWVGVMRTALALDGIIPLRGFLDAGDVQLQSWLVHTYPGFTFRVWAQNVNSGNLQARPDIGEGGTVVNLLLHGNHFEPLWPRG